MKNLQQMINESVSKQTLIQHISKATQEFTGHLFKNDKKDKFKEVNSIKEIINDILKDYNKREGTDKYELTIDSELAQYQQTKNNDTHWLNYKVEITKDNHKFITGELNCNANGNMNNIWSAYTMTLNLY